jgi:hypothetical protein
MVIDIVAYCVDSYVNGTIGRQHTCEIGNDSRHNYNR